MKTKYDIIVRNGTERFVLVPEKDYRALIERLEDEEDFRAIEEAKKRNAGKPLIPFEQVVRELGLTRPRKKAKR
jgi:hypothetical protein